MIGVWDHSYEYVVGGRGGHVEDLEEGGAQDDEEEDSQQPWANLGGFLLLLGSESFVQTGFLVFLAL
jgi:hypothetical protein